jgi:dienelactone hydrolase
MPSPFDRGPANGFPLRPLSTPPPRSLLRRSGARSATIRSRSPWATGLPVIRGAYAYAPRELKTAVDEVDGSSPYWRKEKVSFSAAYGDERVPASVFLPKNAKPPYQALVYSPGAGAVSSTFASMDGFNRMEFIIRSGRAVIYPIYIGTFNRRLPPTTSEIQQKERYVRRFQDLRQTVEYLVSRSDIDASKLAYFGASVGAGVAPVMVSLEQRFRPPPFEGGLYPRPAAAEVDNFTLPRVRVPVLANGRYDYISGGQSSHASLGTPEKDKRHVLYDAAHDVMVNRTEVVKEVLSWLDQYLGPVAR